VAAGWFVDVDAACAVIRLRPEVAEPDPRSAWIYHQYHEVYRAAYPATAATMWRLSELAAAEASDNPTAT
jgi:hypothetical protein